jgi:transcriptional regulator with XRE-family HTH domain
LDKNDLADRFRALRNKVDLSQKDFAQTIGVSQSVIAEIERGSREPSRSVLVAIAEKYQISLDWLLLGVGSGDVAQRKEDPEVEALKKEIAEMEDTIRALEAENKEISRELLDRMRQLVDVQSRQLGTA